MKCNLPQLIDLYNLRAKQNERLTQAKLAEDTGLSPNTINRLYRNKATRYDSGTVATLCKFFDCGVQDLLKLSDE